MWKYLTPAIFGLGLLVVGAAGAQAQAVTYSAPYAYYPPGVCLNHTFNYGYGGGQYDAYCTEGLQAPSAWKDPYARYRPYSDNVGPKASD